MKKEIPAGAKANTERKEKRQEVVSNSLRRLGPSARFKSKYKLFEYLAEVVAEYEKNHDQETKKGACTASGLSQNSVISTKVEVFFLTGELSDEPNIGKSKEIIAVSSQRSNDLEISNLKFEITELERHLMEEQKENKKLSKYIETSNEGILLLEQKAAPNTNDQSKIIEELCQVILKLEIWSEGILERTTDGSIFDHDKSKELISKKLMHEYHTRIPQNKLEM